VSDLSALADAISDALLSEREGDTSDAANIVDAVYSLSRALKYLGNGDAATTMGGLEAHGVAMKEAAESIERGLESIATAITALVVELETRR
jgi:hypothetical protein